MRKKQLEIILTKLYIIIFLTLMITIIVSLTFKSIKVTIQSVDQKENINYTVTTNRK